MTRECKKNAGMRAKKSLSQHFLIDPQVIDQIVRTCHVKSTDRVIEVGPGTAALSDSLSDLCQSLSLIEIDVDLINLLRSKFKHKLNTQIIHQDAMQFDFASFSAKPYKLIGNLPYHLSTALVQRFVEANQSISEMYLMVQKETADRICAAPNSGKHRGWLSVFVQGVYETEPLFDIQPHSFHPQPKVQSTFIRLSRAAKFQQIYRNDIIFAWKSFLLWAFSNKRKNLKNNFLRPSEDILSHSSRFKKISLSSTDWNSLEINPLSRAEQLNMKQWVNLFNFCVSGESPPLLRVSQNTSSFLRKQESRCWFDWIPAFAGMTRAYQERWNLNSGTSQKITPCFALCDTLCQGVAESSQKKMLARYAFPRRSVGTRHFPNNHFCDTLFCRNDEKNAGITHVFCDSL